MNQVELMLKNLGKLREETKNFVDEVPNLREDLQTISDRAEHMFKLYFEKNVSAFPSFDNFKTAKKSFVGQTHVATLMNAVLDSIRIFATSYISKIFPQSEKEKATAVMVVLHFAVIKSLGAVVNGDKEPVASDPSTDLIFHSPDGIKTNNKSWDLILAWAITGFDHDYLLTPALLGSGDLTAKKLAILDTIISIFPESGKCKDMFGFQAIHYAARINSVEVWNRVYALDPDAIYELSGHGETPLHVAAAFSSSEEVIAAVYSANKNAVIARTSIGQLPLHHAAAFSSSVGVVNAVLQAGSAELLAASDAEGNKPLHGAAENGNYDIVSLLLKANPAIVKTTNSLGMYPLSKAALSCRHVETVKLLDEAFPQAMTESRMMGILPIHLVMTNCYSTDILEYIISRHPDALGVRDSTGAMPIHWLVNTPEEINLRMIDFIRIVTERFPACKSAKVGGSFFSVAAATGGADGVVEDQQKTAYQIARRYGVTDPDALELLKPEGGSNSSSGNGGADAGDVEEDEELGDDGGEGRGAQGGAQDAWGEEEDVSDSEDDEDETTAVVAGRGVGAVTVTAGDDDDADVGGDDDQEDDDDDDVVSDDDDDDLSGDDDGDDEEDDDAAEYGMQMSRIMDTISPYCDMQRQCIMNGMTDSQATDYVLQRVQEAVRRGEVGNPRLRELQQIMDKKDEEFLARFGTAGDGDEAEVGGQQGTSSSSASVATTAAAVAGASISSSPQANEIINKLCFRYQCDQNSTAVMNLVMSGKNDKEVARALIPQLIAAVRKGDYGTVMGRSITDRDLIREVDPFFLEMRGAYFDYIASNPSDALTTPAAGAGGGGGGITATSVAAVGSIPGSSTGTTGAVGEDGTTRRKVRARKPN